MRQECHATVQTCTQLVVQDCADERGGAICDSAGTGGRAICNFGILLVKTAGGSTFLRHCVGSR